MTRIPIYQVDAFTDRPFAGNPAAVCILSQPADDAWMQNVANEMNLSETAFLLQQEDGYLLRWFTPAAEVALCGHATLASAHVLWETRRLPLESQARFHTLSGLLTAERQGDWIELDFPAKPLAPAEPPPNLIESLGTTPVFIGKNQFDYLVEVENEDAVRRMEPDIARLKLLPVRGVIVTSRATTPGYDFISRFFAPAVGVNEDPVTGSAHTCLAPYWAARLGKIDFMAYQASARGGILKVRLVGDRVRLGGQAVLILTGELV